MYIVDHITVCIVEVKDYSVELRAETGFADPECHVQSSLWSPRGWTHRVNGRETAAASVGHRLQGML